MFIPILLHELARASIAGFYLSGTSFATGAAASVGTYAAIKYARNRNNKNRVSNHLTADGMRRMRTN